MGYWVEELAYSSDGLDSISMTNNNTGGRELIPAGSHVLHMSIHTPTPPHTENLKMELKMSKVGQERRVRALAALAEDLGLIPSIHEVAHSHL